MADWPAKKNAAFNIHFPIYDADGDLVSGAAGLDSEVSIDHGTFTDCTNEATEIATSSGVYYLALVQAEMNGDVITTITKTSTSGAKTAVNVMYTATRQLVDLAFPATSGRSMVVDASGLVDANAVKVGPTGAGTAQTARDLGTSVLLAVGTGTGQVNLSSGKVPATIAAGDIANDAITAAAINTGALTADAFAADAIVAATLATGVLTAAAFAADAIVAATLATGALTADAFAADAIAAATLATGAITNAKFAAGAIDAAAIADGAIDNATFAADVGSTAYATNIIALAADKALVSENLDHLAKTATAAADMTTEVADNTILARVLGNGDTSTFVPSTDGLHAAGVDLDAILEDTGTTLDGRIPAALVSGRMDASVGAMAADVITASALATDAANEIADALLKRDIDQVEATAALHSLCTAVLKAVSRVRDNAGTLEIYRTNGTTLHMSQTVTTDVSLDPVDELSVGA